MPADAPKVFRDWAAAHRLWLDLARAYDIHNHEGFRNAVHHKTEVDAAFTHQEAAWERLNTERPDLLEAV